MTTRAELGWFLLPWCVDTRDRTRPVRISDNPSLIPHALQLRVRDVDQEAIRVALCRQVADGGFSWKKIESIVTEAMRDGRPPKVGDSKAFRVRDGLTLMEGCHRTCALYLLDPPALQLTTEVVPPEESWPAYFDRRLEVSD
jgi:hypothetical protein